MKYVTVVKGGVKLSLTNANDGKLGTTRAGYVQHICFKDKILCKTDECSF